MIRRIERWGLVLITGLGLEVIEEEIESFVFGAEKAVGEGEDLIESVDFESVASYFEFLLY